MGQAMTMRDLARNLGHEYIELEAYQLDLTVLKLIKEEVAQKYCALPLEKRDQELVVAISDPFNSDALEDLKAEIALPIIWVVASKSKIEERIAYYYTHKKISHLISESKSNDRTCENKAVSKREMNVQDAPFVKMANEILHMAVKEGASDIHIEPSSKDTRIRIRVDGQLIEKLMIKKHDHEGVITRFKIISDMNIGEKRLPQDGKLSWKDDKGAIDMRFSSMPTIYGEKIVIRLMGRRCEHFQRLETLGLPREARYEIEQILKGSGGILLVTGPTGSGKTTSLYAMLEACKEREDNIVTLEDPVECRLEGVNQVAILPKAGLTFEVGLRALLRQDPDVIMIGEIRDEETTHIAIRAALTGHLVLSTLHTNDGISTMSRLIDMGVAPYLLADALKGIVSQRLVRRICPHCKVSYQVGEEEKRSLKDLSGDQLDVAYRGRGCFKCYQTGYKGRLGVFEWIAIDEGLKGLITKGTSSVEMRTYLKEKGLLGLKDQMKQLIKQGETSIEEYRRIGL